MKKLFLASAIALFGLSNAQFRLGAHAGLPIGDAGDSFSFTLGADAAYMWSVADGVNLGVATGYSAWLGKTITVEGSESYKVETMSMVPVAASAEYLFTPEFSLGVDLGYAFMFVGGSDSGESTSDGAFYYQPKVAYHFGPSAVSLGYAGVSKNGATISSINVGYTYTFGK
jgi:hypothetical protein